MNTMTKFNDNMNLYNQYKDSVYALADKLPQWSSAQKDRRYKAAISSMFEEVGEISGLISKYRTRTNKKGIDFYNTPLKELPYETVEEIKEKFLDETGDICWVFTATCHVSANEGIGIFTQFAKAEADNLDISFEDSLFNIFGSIFTFYVCSCSLEDDVRSIKCLQDIAYDLGVFIYNLNKEYGITLEDILKHNMEKLGFRYDVNGKRVDGVL